MTKVLVTEDYLEDIADAIRAKNGSATTYTPGQMAAAIEAIPTGGGDVTVVPLSVSQNGTYTAPAGQAYNPVVVDVSGGGGSSGVYVGTDVPSDSIGSNGDYYYRRSNRQYGYSTTPGSSSSTTQSGYEFTANYNITVVGLRAYVRGDATATLYLAAENGSIIKQIDDVSCALGWNEAYFDTPVQLTAGSNYIVQVKINTSRLSYQSKSATVFNSLITGVRGRYGSLPGTTDGNNIYSADIIIGVDDLYYVTEQYKKISGAWARIA